MKKSLLFLILICTLSFLCACNGSVGGAPPGPTFGNATHLSVNAPANATAGTQFQFTVTVLDASNRTVATYSGKVHFTSTDGQAVLPADSTLTSGTAQFQATLNTDGGETITATDTVTSSIQGPSGMINVSAASATNPVPLINEPLGPDATNPGGPDFNLTVNGTGFVPGSAVNWNGAERVTTFVSNSRLIAVIHAADVANFNTASVTVVNPAPGGGTSNVAYFETTRPTAAVALSLASQFNVGPLPNFVTTGDFNADGKLDLVISDFFSNSVNILLGKGDGTFQPAVNYAAGTAPVAVAVGDFDDDGKLDLAVLNNGSGNVSILLGNGDGTFQPAVNYSVDANPLSVAAGDFNGDGKLDLVVASPSSGHLSVLLGNGNGTFQPAVDYNADSNPLSVAVGDFNGDGKLDLAVGNSGTGDVSILLGNGDGTFKTAVNYPLGSGSSAQSVAVGDLNGDGKLDLVCADSQSLSVFALLGNGDGTFRAAKSYAVESSPSQVAIVDLKGDGKLDVAVAYNISQIADVSVLFGNGDGTFQPAVNFGAEFGASSISLGDFNGDGRMDIAGVDTSGSLAILLQPTQVSGPGVVLSSTSVAFPTQVIGTTSPAQTVTLTNIGSEALNITNISVSSSFAETNTCEPSVAAGANCAINVTFTPGAMNLVTGTLTIIDNALGSPQTINLGGQGTVVRLVPSTMRFGCFRGHCDPPKTATLTNTGSTTLHITGISIGGPFSQTNNCPPSLATGQSCTVTVTYFGNISRLSRVLVTDDGGGSPQVITLVGVNQL